MSVGHRIYTDLRKLPFATQDATVFVPYPRGDYILLKTPKLLFAVFDSRGFVCRQGLE